MTLDEQLLEKATSASSRVEAAERESQIARAEYHTVIRRLHLAGGSLRCAERARLPAVARGGPLEGELLVLRQAPERIARRRQ